MFYYMFRNILPASGLLSDFEKVEAQIYHACCHHCNCSSLSGSVACKSHEQRENGTSEKAHDHESGDFVFLVRHGKKRLGENDGEHIAVPESDEGYRSICHIFGIGYQERYHRNQHASHTYSEERF